MSGIADDLDWFNPDKEDGQMKVKIEFTVKAARGISIRKARKDWQDWMDAQIKVWGYGIDYGIDEATITIVEDREKK